MENTEGSGRVTGAKAAARSLPGSPPSVWSRTWRQLKLQIKMGFCPDGFGVGQAGIVNGADKRKPLRNGLRQMVECSIIGKMFGDSLGDLDSCLFVPEIHGDRRQHPGEKNTQITDIVT